MRKALILLACFLFAGCNKPAICYVIPVCTEAGVSDVDEDGFTPPEDCNDADPEVNPDAVDDPCDGIDNDCDGYMYDGRGGQYADSDGDGYGDPMVFYDFCDTADGGVPNMDDCDDAEPSTHPGQDDQEDGVDNDCDGEVDEDVEPVIDQDHDGFDANVDCDDLDAFVNPDAVEVCDTVDNDCNGLTDDADSGVTDQQTWYADADHDGYGDENDAGEVSCFGGTGDVNVAQDCNDLDANTYPGASEGDCEDPVDYNCDGATGFQDQDGDLYPACLECNDLNADSYPGASELCDGEDNDCNGITDDPDAVTNPSTFHADFDGDSYGDAAETVTACEAPAGYVVDATDCDDAKALVKPGGTEVCDTQGGDEDCDGTANDADPSVTGKTTWYRDQDGDGSGGSATMSACVAPPGYVAQTGDCKDTDTAYHPGAPETSCTDPNDYNCDGVTGFVDGDADGTPACQDCNDANAAIHPGAAEVCNGKDDNCNGTTDGATEATNTLTFYQDSDGDGSGNGSVTTRACTAPAGYVATAGDCDDTKVGVNPLGLETCNGYDDDCDSLVDASDPTVTGLTTYYRDADGDTYGKLADTKAACSQPASYVTNATDCNDAAPAINPAATEVCDNKDNNCNGSVDEGVKITYYRDADADTYGALGVTSTACSVPVGYVAVSTDCDDAAFTTHPGAAESCNGVDDNCDTSVDEGVKNTYYRDADSDGYGTSGTTQSACSAPSGYVAGSTDCDDTKASVHPTAVEACNGVDEDCDSLVDEGVTTNYYRDADSDGFGKLSDTKAACSQPSGYVANSTDCNDALASVSPNGTESCNGVDDDCDGSIDEGLGGATYYRDADGDGFGKASDSKVACSQPSGYVVNATDCDDANSGANPSVAEACNGYDDDCDGSVDEGFVGWQTYYRDADGDNYGDATNTKVALTCYQPAGYVSTSGDCDDARNLTHPGAQEFCNGKDDDCDTVIDDSCI